MAKQYIDDNIELNPRVSDVADFCYLSTRQLTRIFREKEQITPAAYIKKKQIAYFENLLCKSELSLREIAEKMNFSSEYTFNSFFLVCQRADRVINTLRYSDISLYLFFVKVIHGNF